MTDASSQTLCCPNCDHSKLEVIYTAENVPVNSVLLLSTRQDALDFPTGDIRLGFCPACGFITNLSFEPKLLEYSARYESTQSYSPTYSQFADMQAQKLVERYNLHGKKIVEIGCGQGEFLKLLCHHGANTGIGYDPAYIAQRHAQQDEDIASTDTNLHFIADYYSEKYSDPDVDFICCKMTLEHIHATSQFVEMVRRSINTHAETVVFFQVPNVTRILESCAFWDIYYEHCSYFSPGSLARLFHRHDFTILDLYTDYGDQYVMIEARPGRSASAHTQTIAEDRRWLQRASATFSQKCAEIQKEWRQFLARAVNKQQKVILWGGGSKAVSFLTTLDITTAVEYVVDLNPNKHGTYLPRTGQKVVAPSFLKEYRPDVVIVMNPIYEREIAAQIAQMDLNAQIIPLG